MMSPHVRPSVPGIGSSRLMVWILRLCFCRSLWTAEAIALQAIVLNSYLYKSGRLNQFFTVSRYRNITTSNQSSTGRRCDRRKRNTRLKFCSATACSAGDSGLSWAGTSYPSSQNNVSWGVCSGCSAGGACSASGGGCSDSGPVRITFRLSNVNRIRSHWILAGQGSM